MMTQTKCRVNIRWMIRRDLVDVLAIENTRWAHVWREEDFLRVLRQRNCIGLIAEAGDRVVGFVIYELHKSKIEVLNLAVDPEFRRRGVGRRLVEKLADKVSVGKRNRVGFDVRETNHGCCLWLRALGVRAIAVLRNHFGDGEDGIRFVYVRPAEEPATA